MRARSYHLIRVFTAVIIAVIAFSGGFMVRAQSNFLASLGFPESITGVSASKATESAAGGKDVYNSLSSRVQEVEDILENKSIDQYDLNTATEAALNVFDDATGDPYVRYYSEERYNELLNRDEGTYAGIGALFGDYEGQAYVVDVFEGSPAWEEGIHVNDFVVSIEVKEEGDGESGDTAEGGDGEAASGESQNAASEAAQAPDDQSSGDEADSSGAERAWSRNDVTALLSQSEGKEVSITWRRPESFAADGGDMFTKVFTCAKFDEANVTSSYDSSLKVGYIKVKQLVQNTAQNVQKAIGSLEKQGAAAYVLDLRDNPGGYLSQAVDLSSLFINSGVIVSIKTKDGDAPKNASGKTVTSAPLVVLVNKNTAAAAEVVAAALKEAERASETVGETTLGKGSVQVIDALSFGGAMQYTAAYYLTRQGHSINGVGVVPSYPLSATGNGSNQTRMAMRLAGALVPDEAQAAEEQ